jgi:hypothetical protein
MIGDDILLKAHRAIKADEITGFDVFKLTTLEDSKAKVVANDDVNAGEAGWFTLIRN